MKLSLNIFVLIFIAAVHGDPQLNLFTIIPEGGVSKSFSDILKTIQAMSGNLVNLGATSEAGSLLRSVLTKFAIASNMVFQDDPNLYCAVISCDDALLQLSTAARITIPGSLGSQISDTLDDIVKNGLSDPAKIRIVLDPVQYILTGSTLEEPPNSISGVAPDDVLMTEALNDFIPCIPVMVDSLETVVNPGTNLNQIRSRIATLADKLLQFIDYLKYRYNVKCFLSFLASNAYSLATYIQTNLDKLDPKCAVGLIRFQIFARGNPKNVAAVIKAKQPLTQLSTGVKNKIKK